MNRQRGFITPFAVPTWVIYAAVIATALVALWYAYDTVDGRGYSRGKTEAEAAYAKRDNKALADALARVETLRAEIRARESAHDAELQKIAEKRTKEKADDDQKHARDIAAVRAGTLKLRDPGASAGAQACTGSKGSAPAAAGGGRDGTAAGELSAEAAEFLLSLMREADDIVGQLGAAQAVIRAQIRTCNGS